MWDIVVYIICLSENCGSDDSPTGTANCMCLISQLFTTYTLDAPYMDLDLSTISFEAEKQISWDWFITVAVVINCQGYVVLFLIPLSCVQCVKADWIM